MIFTNQSSPVEPEGHGGVEVRQGRGGMLAESADDTRLEAKRTNARTLTPNTAAKMLIAHDEPIALSVGFLHSPFRQRVSSYNWDSGS